MRQLEEGVTFVRWHEGDVIRKLRTAFGWTIDDLSERSGVHGQTIHRIEVGTTRSPTRDTLDRIAQAFMLTRRELEDAVPRDHVGVPLRTHGEVAGTPRPPKRGARA